MADAYKKLYQGQLAAAAATIYTVPALTSAIVKHMSFVNGTGAAVTMQLFRGGLVAANAITPVMSVPAGGFAEWDGTMALAAGETIAAVAGSAASITGTIDGDEVT